MTDGIDRVLRVRVIAEGLPATPRKNPWKCRAVSGLALAVGFGADGSVDFDGVATAPTTFDVRTTADTSTAPVVDTLSQTNITVYGTNFSPAAAVTVGGVSATSVTWVSSGELTCDAPSGLSAGSHAVVVTNPDLQNSGGTVSVEAWNPLVDSPSVLLLPGDYANPTPGTASTGTWTDSSGNGNNAVAYNTNPAEGTTGADIGCPVFTAAEALDIPKSFCDDVFYPTASDRLADRTNGTAVVIDVPSGTLPADGGAYYNGALMCGNSATPGFAPTDSGLRAWGYDGSVYLEVKTANVPVSGTPEIGFMRWDATGLEIRKDGGAFDAEPYTAGFGPLDAGNIGSITHIGSSYAYSYLYAGTIRLVAVFRTYQSDSWCSKFRTWAKARGYLA